MKSNIITGSARVNGKKVSVTYDVPLFDPPNLPPPRPVKGITTHARDFTWVNWFGVTYYFAGPQCLIVGHLWKAAEDDIGSVDGDRLTDAADCPKQRLRDLFRNNPAWGTLIVQDPNNPGRYMLSEPV